MEISIYSPFIFHTSRKFPFIFHLFFIIHGNLHSFYIFPNLTGSLACCQDVPARPAADDVREGLGRGRLRRAARSAQLEFWAKYLHLKKRIL